MADEQPRLDAVDMHSGALNHWLRNNPGRTAKDLLQRFVDLGVWAFIFKATEGRTFRDKRLHQLVAIASELGIRHIGVYHVNLRGDGGTGRVDAEVENFLAHIDGLPIGARMVDWETWSRKDAATGTWVERAPDDPNTGGTLEQTALLLEKLEADQPGRQMLYSGLPLVARGLNNAALRPYPFVLAHYGKKSWPDPVARTADRITDVAKRLVMHQWAGGTGVLGFDSNRVIDRDRFDQVFGVAGTPATQPEEPRPTPGPPPPKAIRIDQLPELRVGDSGQPVKNMQGLLVAHGLGIAVTGQFDEPTRFAVELFQAAAGLTKDGRVGPRETWPALLGLR